MIQRKGLTNGKRYAIDNSRNMIELLLDEEYTEELTKRISGATAEILFTQFHIGMKSTDGKSLINEILRGIASASARGVFVSCLMPNIDRKAQYQDGNIRSMEYMTTAGIHCYYMGYEYSIHSKFFLFDKSIAIIGSHNLTDRSLKSTFETSIVTDAENVCKNLSRKYNHLIARAKKFSL